MCDWATKCSASQGWVTSSTWYPITTLQSPGLTPTTDSEVDNAIGLNKTWKRIPLPMMYGSRGLGDSLTCPQLSQQLFKYQEASPSSLYSALCWDLNNMTSYYVPPFKAITVIHIISMHFSSWRPFIKWYIVPNPQSNVTVDGKATFCTTGVGHAAPKGTYACHWYTLKGFGGAKPNGCAPTGELGSHIGTRRQKANTVTDTNKRTLAGGSTLKKKPHLRRTHAIIDIIHRRSGTEVAAAAHWKGQ